MRFDLPPWPTSHFQHEIWVKCPRCSDIARVAAQSEDHSRPARLTCSSCGLKKETGEKWYGDFQAMLFQACGFCGSNLHYISTPTKNTPAEIPISCDICGKEKPYAVQWRKFAEVHHTDPFFGLELWCQSAVKGQTLWIYNREHLQYLRRYIAAKLRDDRTRHKYSLITNLPDWIRAAKNREILLKKLDAMDAELIAKTAS